jgi:hypothetical protein
MLYGPEVIRLSSCCTVVESSNLSAINWGGSCFRSLVSLMMYEEEGGPRVSLNGASLENL